MTFCLFVGGWVVIEGVPMTGKLVVPYFLRLKSEDLSSG